MNFFEKEMREMFGNSELLRDAKFCGKVMMTKLDEDLRLKLLFITRGTVTRFEGIKAIVFDRSEGVVDKNYFVFSDILGYKAIGEEYEKPVIIEDGIRTGWNMPVSAEEKGQIAGAILNYVEMFASPDMAPQM